MLRTRVGFVRMPGRIFARLTRQRGGRRRLLLIFPSNDHTDFKLLQRSVKYLFISPSESFDRSIPVVGIYIYIYIYGMVTRDFGRDLDENVLRIFSESALREKCSGDVG